jgi:hypothetical protein
LLASLGWCTRKRGIWDVVIKKEEKEKGRKKFGQGRGRRRR